MTVDEGAAGSTGKGLLRYQAGLLLGRAVAPEERISMRKAAEAADQFAVMPGEARIIRQPGGNGTWTSPTTVDTTWPHFEARSNASGPIPPR
jgi:hypothetical protein